MTLTEEQREAIRAVLDLPRAIGCTQCHSYIQEHYGNQFAILRAMIDSSEHIVEPDELIGFDLERARGLRDFLQDDCAEVGDVWAEMIAEIERLRGEMENYGDDYVCQMKSKDARIQELEDALVEERAKQFDVDEPCPARTHHEHCDILKGSCDGFPHIWEKCPRKQKKLDAARQQLQAEGKIGPDAKPWSWQITDERKAALWHAINVLKENDIMEEPEEHLWDEEVTVLQAMLTEAGQE